MKILDLFSGCGGFSFGFQEAGFEIILGIDNVQIALDTFKYNHKNAETFMKNLSCREDLQFIVDYLNKKDGVDIIIAGPPCQGFSLAGSRNIKDKRNKLFYSVFTIIKKLQIKPKAVIIENVPGLATLYKGKAKIEIENKFNENNYICNSEILYAPDFGIPQIRKRLFFVGLLENYSKFEFPNKILTKENYITCEEALSDLPSLENHLGTEIQDYFTNPLSEYQKIMRKNSKLVQNHIGTLHSDLVKNVIAQVPEGGNYKDLPKGVGESRKFNEAWTRYHSKKPSKTIDTGHRNHFHYKFNRQVGNAVPPLLGYHIAMKLKEVLS